MRSLLEEAGGKSPGNEFVRTNDVIERFSIECRKTKTKVITPVNHKEH